MKSKGYLNFLGTKKCIFTNTFPIDLHHCSITRKYSGYMKNKFDFGALPINHEIHLSEIHEKGEDYTFSKYNKNSTLLCVKYIREYIDTNPDDVELAKNALSILENI